MAEFTLMSTSAASVVLVPVRSTRVMMLASLIPISRLAGSSSSEPPTPDAAGGGAPRFDRAGKRRVPVGPDDNLTSVAPPRGIRLQAGAAIDRGLLRPVGVAPALPGATDFDDPA